MNDMSTPEPQWPTQRDLARYQSLLEFDFSQVLAAGGTWIDVGPGVEALPMLPFVDRPDVKLICIGLHERSLPQEITFRKGAVPNDVEFLTDAAGTATVVTDVYSSISYGEDPYLALAYCTLLLKPGGICGAFTELKRLGDLAAWDRAIQFFRTELHTRLSLEAVSIFEDASQSMATALRISAQRVSAPSMDFRSLTAALHQRIGFPVVTGTIWQATDNSAAIRAVEYRLDS